MIRLTTLLTETAITPETVKHINNTEILKEANDLIDSLIKNIPGVRGVFKGIVRDYVNALNKNANLIVTQIRTGKGTETASLYIRTLSDIMYAKLSGLNTVIKFAVSKLYTQDELRTTLENNRGNIGLIYDVILKTALMNMTDIKNLTSLEWYDKAADKLIARKASYIDQIIDAIIKTIYNK
jgi:hypothetical protein